MRGVLAAALLLVLAGCASAPEPRAPAAASQPAPRVSAAEVVRDGDTWTVEFRFSRASPAWLFGHSSVMRDNGRPWRPSSWTVETPGVRIERRGRHDVMFAESGDVPPVVRVRFTPVSADLVAEYDPALIFSDGSVALWSGHFFLRPVASVAAAEALPLDLNGVSFPGDGAQATFRDQAGRVLHVGQRFDSATLIEARSYVLFGPLQPVTSDDIAAVIDPALPTWLKRELSVSTPAIMGRLAEALGPHGGAKPSLLVSWRGPTQGLSSMGGSVLAGQISMTFEGSGVVEENDELRAGARWFIAHEGAHFWLGGAVRYEYARDSWIMEGGADLLAARAIAAIDPAFNATRMLQNSVNECVGFATRPVEQAGDRGENRAYYVCGAVFGMIAESASRRPYSHFVRTLIDANRSDGILTRAEWLAALDQVSRDPTLSRDIGTMLSSGVADPKAMLASLFTRAGIRFTPGEDGVPRLQ